MKTKTLINTQSLFIISLLTVGPELAILILIAGISLIISSLLEKPELAKVYNIDDYRNKKKKSQTAKKAA